ncbi:ATP-dependent DNA ligase I [Ceraceosorus bombacis]|uniref:ATP-dependent DNA ligase I n=1 Tax=Ceraceosorus bombacis TaxID=401625 RepID=A0A0P1BPU8_9BASI|nr:ATP-dependent DNA ligase I [Ceraceosorus bombacis]
MQDRLAPFNPTNPKLARFLHVQSSESTDPDEVKVKKDYIEGIGDTLDLVPIAAWHGMGRKNEWWSPVLLATYDKITGQYIALCKCISGFTDAEYKSIRFDRFKEDGIRGADITLSPVYTVAKGQIASDRGLSLRFPRFIKRRDASDKGPEDATTPEQVAHMYRQQNHAGAHT